MGPVGGFPVPRPACVTVVMDVSNLLLVPEGSTVSDSFARPPQGCSVRNRWIINAWTCSENVRDERIDERGSGHGAVRGSPSGSDIDML